MSAQNLQDLKIAALEKRLTELKAECARTRAAWMAETARAERLEFKARWNGFAS